ncbi:MAG: DUF167 domain-containing protein [Gammaproteobacteria bacterium]|nr:DUF167 domain-containing protein [Gammaproteobacteria bacterium]
MENFYTWEGKNLRLNVLGTPGAKLNKIGKVKGNQLKISVTCPPENGKATKCMIKFLSKEFNVKASNINLVFGLTSINKQFIIIEPQHLPEMISRANV